MTVADAPRTELGYPAGVSPTYSSGLGAGFYVDGLEFNGALRFPDSAVVYDRMRTEDGQVGSVLEAITLPMLGTGRRLVGDEVRPEVLAFVERELGIDVDAGVARRRRQGIVLGDHLREALLCLPFGFMPFEVVYDVGPAAPGIDTGAEAPGRLYAHLRKLAPRMPRTLAEVRVERDGGLAGIVQNPPPGTATTAGVFIPRDRLVVYVNNREGADWTGRSVLRTSYKHWLIKDALIRLGAQIVERNGMGIPVVSYANDTDKAEAERLAREFRAGALAGAALKQGMSLSVVGVAGSTADELPRIKYHDESIGRSLLAMFLNLGHDNGARALGATFVDYFLLAVNAKLRLLEETVTEHIIRDLVELNYGEDEPYPALKFDDLTAEATPTAEALKMLADAGLITPDRETEQDIRRRYRLPAKPEPQGEQALEDAAGNPFANVGIPALIDAGIITPDEGRQMLKLPGTAPGPAAVPGGAVDPNVVPDDGLPEELELEDAEVVLPAAMAANLSAHRAAIRDVLHLKPLETPAAAGLEDRLEALVDRLAALRAGHRT